MKEFWQIMNFEELQGVSILWDANSAKTKEIQTCPFQTVEIPHEREQRQIVPNRGLHIYIYIYIYRRLGGVSPTGESFHFVPAYVRCEAACARGTMLLPRLGGGSSGNAPPGRRRASSRVAGALRLSVG